MAQDVAMRIKILADAKQGIDAFRDLKTGVEAAKQKLQEATNNIKTLVQAANTGKLKMLTDAQKDADGAKAKIESAKRELEFFKRSAEVGGAAGAKMFAKDIAGAERAIKAATKELDEHNAKVKTLQATAATALPEYARQIERAKKEAKALKEAVEAKNIALEKSRRALAAAGIDTTKLAEEQVKLNRAQKESAANMAAWGRQAAAGSAATKQMSAAQAEYATKARAAADADKARATLGVRSNAEIKASIDRINAALTTLRSNGTSSAADLARATAAAKAKVADLTREMSGASTTSERLGNSFNTLRNAFFAFQALIAAGGIIKMVDDMARLEARMLIAEGSSEKAASAMAGVQKIAYDTAAPIQEVADAYIRFSTAILSMGYSQGVALKFTDALAKALKISGASGQETASVMRQLSQAFNKGKLNGDEFVSVAENGGKVLDYLGIELGKTRGELAAMASAGELTADKLLKLGNAAEQIDKDFSRMPTTLGDAFVRVGNAVTVFASKSTVLRGVINALAQSLQFVSERLDVIVGAVFVVGIGVLIASFGGLLGAVSALTAGLTAAGIAMLALMKAHPVLLAIGVAAAVLVAVWDKLPDSVKKFNETPLDQINEAIVNLDSHLKELDAKIQINRASTEEMIKSFSAAYQVLAENIDASMQAQTAAVQARYNEEMALIAASGLSATDRMAAEQAALFDSINAQVAIQKEGLGQKLALIEEEYAARRDAAARSSNDDQIRANAVRTVELELLQVKRDAMESALDSYRSHIDALNGEANRHLEAVRRIEEEKAGFTQSTEEKVRRLQQSAMTAAAAYADQQLQIEENLAAAKAAIKAGDFQQAQEYGKKAIDIATNTAREIKEGDRVVVDQKAAVASAIGKIGEASALVSQALDAEKSAHLSQADSAVAAAGRMKLAMAEVSTEIDALTKKLSTDATISVTTNLDALKANFADFDRLYADKQIVWNLRTNAEQVRKDLDELKKPGTSTHTVRPDLNEIRRQIEALSRNTSSIHTVYINKVQKNATGGLIQHLANGGAPSPFRRRSGQAGGRISGPGNGTSDSIPAMLSNGEYVIRAASVAKFGESFMAAINAGFLPAMPRFAAGGLAAFAGPAPAASSSNAAENVNLNFNIGGQTHRTQSSRQTAMQLSSALRDLARVGA